ncbi:flavin reductase family protein [Roseomonas sp. NAR14]|uniref:Flavin reductase family protein n=1 Tax=Roseomonas acroporae TaxID=2937791 RepID=A0A9X1Y798_9PROT|nr:flavin reductase family protein [Roseomonas acroporae]MCK8784420.1 flavin reductase family protein [Roseomonas acroporae]
MDTRQFRNALGRFATGVAVITAKGPEEAPIGMTMSSFNAVSLDPPLVLFSVDRRANSLPAILAAEGYAVNVLGQDQQPLSDRFARAGIDKWAGVTHRLGHAEAPLLEGAIAHFECAPHAVHEAGDHVIVVARVLRFAACDEAPLIFFGGRYRGLAGTANTP